MTRIVELTCGALRCLVAPECGGSLAGVWLDSVPILRPATEEQLKRGDAEFLSGFPLVPYSNRIADAAFRWGDQQIRLRRNRADEDHALHGTGWTRPWQVTDLSADAALLALRHDGDQDWPWAFAASQTIRLTPDSLQIDLTVTNREPMPVPLASGYHPYFSADGARIQLSADRVWLADERNLPRHAHRPAGLHDLGHGRAFQDLSLDNCYQGVCWPATVAWPSRGLAVEVTASPGWDHAVVYANAATRSLCIEPVAHVSNALGDPEMAQNFPVVGPGESASHSMSIQIVQHA